MLKEKGDDEPLALAEMLPLALPQEGLVTVVFNERLYGRMVALAVAVHPL